MESPNCSCGWASDNLILEYGEWNTKYYETIHGAGLNCNFCPVCGDKLAPPIIEKQD
jgi:hypothetical protein